MKKEAFQPSLLLPLLVPTALTIPAGVRNICKLSVSFLLITPGDVVLVISFVVSKSYVPVFEQMNFAYTHFIRWSVILEPNSI